MSMTTSRVGLRHRTTVMRDANAGQTDAGGQDQPPDWQDHLTSVPCRAWTTTVVEPADKAKAFVMEDRRVIMGLDTDVTEADQLGDIIGQYGNVIFPGPMNILGVQRYPDHLELTLEDVR